MNENAFQKAIERITATSFLTENSVRILKDGVLAFGAVFDSIKKAERQICVEFYIFRDDETGWELAELLHKKSREGVKVFLIYDHFGSLSTSDKFWNYLKAAGVQVRAFHPPNIFRPNLYFHRDHRKLVVVDGETGFTGGLNVGDEYHGFRKKKIAGWRDTGVQIKGPAVLPMWKSFWEVWKDCGGTDSEVDTILLGETRQEEDIKVLPFFSSSRKSMHALNKLLQFSVHSAQKSIHLTMAYFIPTRKFLYALLRAARRGVDVKIILPGKSDLRLIAYVGRTYYKTLMREGVQIFHYQPRILHAKTMIFDEKWVIVGSANLDARSLNYNYECGVGILDKNLGEEMEELFRQDLAESIPITKEEQSRWPLHERALGTFFSWFRSYL
jgi:cardiolipin synthase